MDIELESDIGGQDVDTMNDSWWKRLFGKRFTYSRLRASGDGEAARRQRRRQSRDRYLCESIEYRANRRKSCAMFLVLILFGTTLSWPLMNAFGGDESTEPVKDVDRDWKQHDDAATFSTLDEADCASCTSQLSGQNVVFDASYAGAVPIPLFSPGFAGMSGLTELLLLHGGSIRMYSDPDRSVWDSIPAKDIQNSTVVLVPAIYGQALSKEWMTGFSEFVTSGGAVIVIVEHDNMYRHLETFAPLLLALGVDVHKGESLGADQSAEGSLHGMWPLVDYYSSVNASWQAGARFYLPTSMERRPFVKSDSETSSNATNALGCTSYSPIAKVHTPRLPSDADVGALLTCSRGDHGCNGSVVIVGDYEWLWNMDGAQSGIYLDGNRDLLIDIMIRNRLRHHGKQCSSAHASEQEVGPENHPPAEECQSEVDGPNILILGADDHSSLLWKRKQSHFEPWVRMAECKFGASFSFASLANTDAVGDGISDRCHNIDAIVLPVFASAEMWKQCNDFVQRCAKPSADSIRVIAVGTPWMDILTSIRAVSPAAFESLKKALPALDMNAQKSGMNEVLKGLNSSIGFADAIVAVDYQTHVTSPGGLEGEEKVTARQIPSFHARACTEEKDAGIEPVCYDTGSATSIVHFPDLRPIISNTESFSVSLRVQEGVQLTRHAMPFEEPSSLKTPTAFSFGQSEPLLGVAIAGRTDQVLAIADAHLFTEEIVTSTFGLRFWEDAFSWIGKG